MKRYSIVVLMLLTLSKGVIAGDKLKLGIKVNPVISFASVKDKDARDLLNYSGQGSGLRFVLGPFIDYAINDNVYFCFGVWYSPRTVLLGSEGLRTDINGQPTLGNTFNSTSQYNLQYLMVPLYFKFYTNEITPGLKIYFTLGGTADFKIAEKKIGDDEVGLKDAAEEEQQKLFSFIDAGLMLGTGVEFKIGEITTVYGGFSYNRGLTNIVNPLLSINDRKPYQSLSIKNNLIGIDLGVKF